MARKKRLTKSKQAREKAEDLLHHVAPVFAEHLAELAASYLLLFPSTCIRLVYEALKDEPEDIKDTVAEFICKKTRNLEKFIKAVELATEDYEWQVFQSALEEDYPELVRELAKEIRPLI
ncbi:MAG: hypothetical protein DRP01_00600 [Archaeoglobales archaeon]|nr:MAG: hypothetical protein DRP01_00600 [Archaeoglobales archaeon]